MIQIHKGQLYIGSYDVSKFFNMNHRWIKELIEDLRFDTFEMQRKTGKKGGQIKEYLICANELKLLIAILPFNWRTLPAKVFCIESRDCDIDFFEKFEQLKF